MGVRFKFWSSGKLTGNQTEGPLHLGADVFWSSGKLTGNQTDAEIHGCVALFWSSGKLTGNQTREYQRLERRCFGAVAN